MKLPIVFLDGPSLGGLLGAGFLFIILPLAAIIFLIYLFVKRKNKNK
jgi:hypothetical protein